MAQDPEVVETDIRELRTDGWIRRTDGRAPDFLSLVFFADAIIPLNGFALRIRSGDVRWHATLTLTIHFHAVSRVEGLGRGLRKSLKKSLGWGTD